MSHRVFNNPNSDAARQHLLDNRCEHKTKRHRTKGRRIRLNKEKRRRIKAHLERVAADRREHLTAVRAYWAGAGNHP